MVHHPIGRFAVSAEPLGEPRLLIAEEHAVIESHTFAAGTVAYFTSRSPDKQTPNEDAIALFPVGLQAGVLTIADGCGGLANGQLASQIAIQALAESLANCHEAEGLRAAILDGFEIASRRVQQLGTGAATTLIAVEINQRLLRTFHVGDSQAVVVGSRGKVKLQTRAHSPVGYALEAGILSEDDALQHEDRHLVSNLIGSHDAHIDLGMPRQLSPRDTLIIGSDGLFDNLLLDEIVQAVRKGPLLSGALTLKSLVMRRMTTEAENQPSKPDDIAVVLYRPHSRP